MAKLEDIVTGDKLLYHDKEFRKKIEAKIPKNLSELSNDNNTVKDANYIHTDNNYTTDDKDKLAGVSSGAQANVIESVSVNGTKQTVTDKGVNVTIPTKVGDLTNDQGYQTAEQVESTVNKAVANSNHLKKKNVTALPTTDIDTNIIYLVPDPNGKTGNEKIEYMYDDDKKAWEQIGTTMTDLDGYVKTTDISEISNTKIDSIITEAFKDTTA